MSQSLLHAGNGNGVGMVNQIYLNTFIDEQKAPGIWLKRRRQMWVELYNDVAEGLTHWSGFITVRISRKAS